MLHSGLAPRLRPAGASTPAAKVVSHVAPGALHAAVAGLGPRRLAATMTTETETEITTAVTVTAIDVIAVTESVRAARMATETVT